MKSRYSSLSRWRSKAWRASSRRPCHSSRRRAKALRRLDQDVEVSHRPEAIGERAHLVSERLRHLALEIGRDDAKGRALTAGSHPHVMEGLDVLALASVVLVGEHALEVEAKDLPSRLGHGLICPHSQHPLLLPGLAGAGV